MFASSVGGRMKASLVREITKLKQNEFYKTLAMLRAQINIQIMEAATQNRKSTYTSVPFSYVGREPYDCIEMGKALVKQLQEDGYKVSGNYLKFLISWSVEEEEKFNVSHCVKLRQ